MLGHGAVFLVGGGGRHGLSLYFGGPLGKGRILTRDWARYDGSHAVFRPSNMTAGELAAGAYWFYEQWNTPARRASRKRRQTRQLGPENARYIAETF